MKLNAPPGDLALVGPDDRQYGRDANGQIDVPGAQQQFFIEQGCTVDTSQGRPTAGLYPGMAWFDFAINKRIFRNALNTGWVDALGGSV